MNKLSLLILFALSACQPAWAQDKLNSKIVKDGDVIPQGWVCYDDASEKKLDQSQKDGLKCLSKLKAYEREIDSLKSQVNGIDMRVEHAAADEWYDATWFKILIGATVGLTIGVVVR